MSSRSKARVIIVALGILAILCRYLSTVDVPHSVREGSLSFQSFVIAPPEARVGIRLYTVQGDSGPILIRAFKHPRFEFGDLIFVKGIVKKPEAFNGFDYPGYLSLSGISSVMDFPELHLIKKDPPLPLLLRLRRAFEVSLNRMFPSEPVSSLLKGLLIGADGEMPKEVKEQFQHSGLSHITAISGTNITLLLTVLTAISSTTFALFGIIFFTLFVGASASVVRACIMGILGIFALKTGRSQAALHFLFFAVTLMLLIKPTMLLYDPGFQLSVLATLGIILLPPLLRGYFLFLPTRFGIRDSILVTLSAQIMTLPLVIFHFKQFSLLSPLANLLISGPIIPGTMFFAFFAALLGMLHSAAGKILGFPAYLIGKYIVFVAESFGKPSLFHLSLSLSLPLLFLALSLLMLLIIPAFRRHQIITRRITRMKLRCESKTLALLIDNRGPAIISP